MIFSKLLLVKVNVIHIHFAPASPHRRIRQPLRPTTQYAHSHRRHLANLAPHASHSCSIKQADSACPHARPARLTSQQYFAFSSPATFIAHMPAPFILLRFCPIPCAARFIAQRVIHFCPSHSPHPCAFPKTPEPCASLLSPFRSHIFAPFSCAPSKAIRQRPSLAHLRALRHAPTTPCAIAALVSHHSVSTSAPTIIAARPLFSPFHSFPFPRRSPKHHAPAPLTLHASANRRIFTPAPRPLPARRTPHRLRPHQ